MVEFWFQKAFIFIIYITHLIILDEKVVCDTPLGKKHSTTTVAASLCALFFTLSLPFVTDAGFLFLDVVDFYVNFVLILVGLFEVLAAGWFWNIDEQLELWGWYVQSCLFWISAHY